MPVKMTWFKVAPLNFSPNLEYFIPTNSLIGLEDDENNTLSKGSKLNSVYYERFYYHGLMISLYFFGWP
jgi:hypothetical protein